MALRAPIGPPYEPVASNRPGPGPVVKVTRSFLQRGPATPWNLRRLGRSTAARTLGTGAKSLFYPGGYNIQVDPDRSQSTLSISRTGPTSNGNTTGPL